MGAGPIGLRTALELALQGAQVHVFDVRSAFSRMNILKLWDWASSDLLDISAEFPCVAVTNKLLLASPVQERLQLITQKVKDGKKTLGDGGKSKVAEHLGLSRVINFQNHKELEDRLLAECPRGFTSDEIPLDLKNVNQEYLEDLGRQVVEMYAEEASNHGEQTRVEIVGFGVRQIHKEFDGAFGLDLPRNFWKRRAVAVDPLGRPAMSIFSYHADLTWLSQPLYLFDDALPVFFAGDALREPFWPMGEGCSRGFMGAFDTVWTVRCWAKGLRGKGLLDLRRSLFDIASQVESHNHGTGVFLPYEQPVPLPGFGWLSLFGVQFPAWGFDGRKRQMKYLFSVDPRSRYIAYKENPKEDLEDPEAVSPSPMKEVASPQPRLDSGALVLSELLAQGLLVEEPLDVCADSMDSQLMSALDAIRARGARVCFVARVSPKTSGAMAAAYQAARESLGPERLLWHGTSWECVPNIVRHGFNRAYAFNARHGSKLGRGVYFAEDPGYALRFAGKTQRTRAMLLAGVLLGKQTRGKEGLLEPPADSRGGFRFDSTCDDVKRPRVFCVFKDFQAIPLYLLQVTP
eukprot:symbB.v1.2.023094.t1/scaffold2090.1/size89944/3